MSDVVGGAPHGAEAAPQAGDVSGAVVPESDGVEARRLYPVTIIRTWREHGWTRFGFSHLTAALVAQKGMTPTSAHQERTAPASDASPSVTTGISPPQSIKVL